MSRTVSARIPKELHEKLRDKCNNLGCSMNDYIMGSIELVLDGNTDFDFGDEEEYIQTEEIPIVKPSKVSYDGGKTWIELENKQEKPVVKINLDE